MNTMKRFAKYAIFLILFWILSDILLKVGIDSTYKNIEQRGNTPGGVEILQMQATSVNGRVKIKVDDESLAGKYLKVDLYSKSGVNLGTQYLEMESIKEEIETYFRIAGVKSYEISVEEEKGETTEGFMDTALSTITVVVTVIKLLCL